MLKNRRKKKILSRNRHEPAGVHRGLLNLIRRLLASGPLRGTTGQDSISMLIHLNRRGGAPSGAAAIIAN